MAQIGHGYGSEWQLLRMLGHHRIDFFENLKQNIPSLKGNIEWLDYRYSDSFKCVSGDTEFIDLNFLEKFSFIPDSIRKEALEDWKSFYPKGQNWDGVFHDGKTVFLVEAKAHLSETSSSTQRKTSNNIKEYMDYIQKGYVTQNVDWESSPYYQMANRLSVAIFLKKHNIPTELVNIFFINGYEVKEKEGRLFKYSPKKSKSVTNELDWKKIIDEENKNLCLNEKARSIINNVFINCQPQIKK